MRSPTFVDTAAERIPIKLRRSLRRAGSSGAAPRKRRWRPLAIFLGAFMFREFGKVEAGLGLALLACALSFVAGIILLVAFGSAT